MAFLHVDGDHRAEDEDGNNDDDGDDDSDGDGDAGGRWQMADVEVPQ